MQKQQDNPRPKVSVIIPVYNVEAYLDRCVRSVLGQTLRDIEVILVDDGSPDGCPAMCDAYARQDPRVKVIHKANAGLGMARNSGLDVATGEYVAFVDSDDFIDTRMYEVLYETALEFDADEVRSSVIFYENGKESIRRDVDKVTVFRGKNEVKRFVLDFLGPSPEEYRDCKYMMSSWLSIHSRKAIEEHNVRFTSERQTLSEDMIFGLDLYAKLTCIVCIPDCFYYYRKNPQSLSHTFSWEKYKRQEIFFKIVKERLNSVFSNDEYKNHYLRLKFLYLRNYISTALNVQGNFVRKYKMVKAILQDKLWNDLFQEYPFSRLPLKKRFYFFALKARLVCLMFIIERIRKVCKQ